ncbi:segregation/condensation protein A [Prochlorothrix hollandica]|uniref:Segregation and condensation protein A n=1 Tax=Prochlorothrix hollandica PCC 9006 = CALU 1027 TaxID=317619 RepID=A0A0M2PZG8_PROHO|nr:segregation/condensation protein A [Prochlorothrix hollandica]KKI99791.1 hypothetical protein PROH_07990 [Prochlorothrix hollandica PCC 9006 = CALU 1027]
MASPAQRAIALLIEMADQGEINPWDVQVVDVIDRFLAELDLDLGNAGRGDRPSAAPNYEANLSESGQAFLYGSMLVLLKADTLARLSEDSLEEGEEFLPEDIPSNIIPLPTNLERQLRRRAVAQPPPQRPVTLTELIEQLELMGEAMDHSSPRPKSRQPKPPSDRQTSRAINQLSYQENPAELAESLGLFLENQWLALVPEGDWLDFDALVETWHQQMGIHPHFGRETPDRVGVFWALLLLSAQSKVELSQAHLYEPLHLRLISPATVVPFPQPADPSMPNSG